MSWLSLGNEFNLFKRWNPARPFVQWYNGYLMNKFLDKELDKHLSKSSSDQMAQKDLVGSNRSIIGLAAESYLAQKEAAQNRQTQHEAFRAFAKTQIRTFMFAGHDTTSSTMGYVYYLLHQNPEAMEKIRQEHDLVFGKEPNEASARLVQHPQLINRVPYTTAAIKEALRLFPPSSSIREGSADCSIVGPDGTKYPTEGMLVWVMHQSLHRNPKYWPKPNEFLPERWLVEPEHPLYPIKEAWRPFEYGPRNCLGQELAMLEVKAVLILTCREFDVTPAYDEWDRMHAKKHPKRVNGDRMYQIERVGAHPSDGFPCKIRMRV